MKLNNKRTILVGLAFFSICAFWQMYNSVIPKILTYTFRLDETFSGVIMAADNVPFSPGPPDALHSGGHRLLGTADDAAAPAG